ncbi:hypothetical protein V8G54_012147 [Vigna mungo]|uniref:Activator of Hsp90 ATPase AHSA1-like N-terminal domain-containing protein n=1 Tax=Vigna mungo TaxID=3915 RepID=A0AAQ3S3J0_VIGMU
MPNAVPIVAFMVIVRNKKRVGYTYELTLKVKGEWIIQGEKKFVGGHIDVPEFSFGELDDLQDLDLAGIHDQFLKLELRANLAHGRNYSHRQLEAFDLCFDRFSGKSFRSWNSIPLHSRRRRCPTTAVVRPPPLPPLPIGVVDRAERSRHAPPQSPARVAHAPTSGETHSPAPPQTGSSECPESIPRRDPLAVTATEESPETPESVSRVCDNPFDLFLSRSGCLSSTPFSRCDPYTVIVLENPSLRYTGYLK